MTADLHTYSEYKDSGLPWLGRVPAHWEVRASKRMFSENGERARPDDEQLSATQAYGVILQSAFEERVGRKVVRIINHLEKRKHVEPDDFVISMRSFQGGLERAFARGAIRSSYVILKPRAEVHVAYFAHLFKSHSYIQALRATSEFIRDGQDLTFANFSRVPLPVVPEDEQKVIADYLDANAVRVRRFIRNRRRLIEVLNEQKQAIINRAVTRGLDPNAKLRHSGVEWLGAIPKHWEVKPLKRWVSINARVLSESTDPDYKFDYLDIGCVGTGILVGKPSRIRFGDAPSRARRILRRGDTIISTVRTYLRAVYFVGEDVNGLVASTGFAALTPRPGVEPEFLGITLQSDSFINRVTANSIGIAYPAIAETRLGTLHVALPPTLEEQRAIVAWVRRETEALTNGIARAQREIELIREYRTRLIADAVTGKLDVRRVAAGKAKEQSKASANVHFKRSVFAAEIVHRLHEEPTFGHVKFEKLIFLCEKHCGVDTGSTYYRQAAGPYDNRALRSIDSQIKRQKWFEARKGPKSYRYVPLEKAGSHKPYFARYYGDIENRFEEMVNIFRKIDTRRCEIVATLYAAWEDLLAQGSVTDDRIMDEVLHNWHPDKQKIPRELWQRALDWMKAKSITPLDKTVATPAARLDGEIGDEGDVERYAAEMEFIDDADGDTHDWS